ncbi:O-glycosyl hydrolase [Arcicella rosea]|uniref:O-glycosyl hydrolase n=2 Tax=Arcicella rosea TaxID=502909 RepID=A0A841EY84_9BACT|nr:O-glycosyl hydrolase [Arcicella rosea]
MIRISFKVSKSFLLRKWLMAYTFLFLLFSCTKAQVTPDNVKTEENKKVNISIDGAKTFQTIEHFGASDAWSCQFVGNWPESKKNSIADLLFSQDTTASGQPKGIGLSLWRFNIGAGSAAVGDESGIRDEWRRAESFMDNDGSYHWDRQAGQIWFLNAAKQRNVKNFLAFTNSPPIQFTVNKKAYASNGKSNLSADKFDTFANFLTTVVKGVKDKTGILFDYVSPVNEPQWEWSDGGQEGTPFNNTEIAGITRSLSASLLKANLATKINIAEAGELNFLYAKDNLVKGYQIADFFEASSSNYVGNLPNLTKAISGHSYFTSSPFLQARDKRKLLAERVATIPNLKYWMSEYCILGDNAGEMDGNKKDLGIDPALYVARTIHNDLVNGNATAWHWWLSISPYDYKDGLIYIDKNKTDGNFSTSKMLWAFGNFSRFVRPNAERIATTVENENTQNNLFQVSSYKDLAQKQLITIIINSDINPVDIKLTLSNIKVSSVKAYVTSKDADLKPLPSTSTIQTITVPARSIITLVGNLE